LVSVSVTLPSAALLRTTIGYRFWHCKGSRMWMGCQAGAGNSVTAAHNLQPLSCSALPCMVLNQI